MTKEEITKQAYAEDLIRAIKNLIASEDHTATLIIKQENRLDKGIVKSDEKQINKVIFLLDELDSIHELRQESMDLLFEGVANDDGDKEFWCNVKHMSAVEKQMFEAYQAQPNNTKAYNIWRKANGLLTRELTKFLGLEITDCASCFGDMLIEDKNKVVVIDNSKNKKRKKI